MKNEIIIIGLFTMSFLSCLSDDKSYIRVNSYASLKAGGRIPAFAGVTDSGQNIGPGIPSGNFHIYFINDRLPPAALDGDFGEVEFVSDQGGHIIGGSDPHSQESCQVVWSGYNVCKSVHFQ